MAALVKGLGLKSQSWVPLYTFYHVIFEETAVICIPVHRDCDQGEYADVYAERLCEGTELAHELGQIPTLEESGVELENGKVMIRLAE